MKAHPSSSASPRGITADWPPPSGGALWHRSIDLRQAQLFSATHHGIGLDFFHLAPREEPLPPDLTPFIEDAIRRRLFIAKPDEARLPQIHGTALHSRVAARALLPAFETAERTEGLVYALTYNIYRQLRGNIFALTAHAVRARAFVSVYHTLPPEIGVEQAQAIVARRS